MLTILQLKKYRDVKYTILMSDIDSGVYMGGGKGYMEISVPPSQFCYKPKRKKSSKKCKGYS